MMVTLTHAGSGLKMQINAARIAALVPVGALGDDANRPKSTKCLVVLDVPNTSY